MIHRVELNGKTVEVHLTRRATNALARLATPLVAEMELYFGCLIRMRVVFREHQDDPPVHRVTDVLGIRFRPVMTQSCRLAPDGAAPPTTDFPLVEPQRFVPRWLTIDHRGGQWRGEFGLSARPAAS